MNRLETPAYYAVTDSTDAPPAPKDCIEGRLFLDETHLLCGAGEAFTEGGYAEKLDDHSASSLRIMFGGKTDPQQVSVNDVEQKDGSISVPLTAIADASVLQWNGNDRRGENATYAVRVEAPNVVSDSLLVQLGKGERNRGTLRQRHATLAAVLDAYGEANMEADSEVSADQSETAEAETYTEPVPGSTETDEPAVTKEEEKTEPTHPDQPDSTTELASPSTIRRFERSLYTLAVAPLVLLGYGVSQSGMPTSASGKVAFGALVSCAVLLGLIGAAIRMRWRVGYYLGLWISGLVSLLGVYGLMTDATPFLGAILLVTLPAIFWGANSKPLFYR